MDGFKRVGTSITEDFEQLAGASEDAMLRMAGITEAVGIPTVGTFSANEMTEEEVKSPKNTKGDEVEKKSKDEPTAEEPSDDEKPKSEQDEGDEDEDEGDEEEDDEDEASTTEQEEGDDEDDDDDEEMDESYCRGVLGDSFGQFLAEAKKAKGKKKKMSALVKELSKRKDIRDPEALAGWLAHYDPHASEDVHPIDGPIVTEEMLRRFAALPFGVMEDSDFDAVIADLKSKTLPADASPELRKLAEDTAVALLEAARKKKKIKKALQKSAKRTIMACTDPDKHWDPKKKACVAKTGKYIVKRRVKTREAGRGIQATHTSQRQRKKKAKGIVSGDERFADRLDMLLRESRGSAPRAESGIRDEILERIDRIFGLIDEEFMDESVADVLLRAMEDLDEKAEAGVLAEDAMSEEDFIAALAPALKLIRASFDKIHEQDEEPEDGDDEDEEQDDSEDDSEDDEDEKDEDLLGNLRAL